MIKRVIKENNGAAASVQHISKQIQGRYKLPDSFSRYLRAALKRLEANKEVYKVRASYKLYSKTLRRKKRASRSKSPARKERDVEESPKRKKKVAKEGEKEAPKKKRAQSPKKVAKEGEKEAPKKKRARVEKEKGPEKKKKDKQADTVKVAEAKYSHFWQYDDSGTWKNYETSASDTVEEVYQKYLGNRGDTDVRAVKSGQWEYQVDFAAMKQMNIQHPTHTVRSIRRVPNVKA